LIPRDEKEPAMRAKTILITALALGALVACTPKQAEEPAPATTETPAADETVAKPVAQPETQPAEMDDDLCKASEYQSLIGANVAAVTLPADLFHRIYKEGDAVTKDYRQDRLNIVTDENGVIIEVKCG
jgi:hypothetical protein